jgi:PAS domain S-box-containing protein
MSRFGNTIRKAIALKKNADFSDIKKNRDLKFSSIIEFAPDAFFQGNLNGNIITVNNKAIELSGYSREELLMMNISKLFPENILIEKPLRYDLLKKGETVKTERELTRKNGEKIQIEMNSKTMPDGTFLTFIRDITERKKAEEDIRISEARLKRAELASKSGNWELHLDTLIIIGSAGASKIYGVEEGRLDYSIIKSVPLKEYRPGMDLALKELIENNSPYEIEFKIKALDTGEIKDIQSIAIYDNEKRILFGAIQDITERKKIEEELIRSKEKAEESDRLKTAFLQNLSHEIRTPMNAIIGFSDLMKGAGSDRNKLEKYSDIIKQRSNDLLDIINDILDIAKIESGQLSVSNDISTVSLLFEEIEDFFNEFRDRIGKQNIQFCIQSKIETSEINIETDIVKLKQILINLISNAFKFTDEGAITLGCRQNESQNLTFYVSDTGIGIPADKQDLIFDRFIRLNQNFDLNAGGNGLGLSIAKGLVNLLGGNIFVDSKPRSGSTFSFTIPCITTHSITQKDSIKEGSVIEKAWEKTILIVEDDLYNAEYLNELIVDLGMNTIRVGNGTDAIHVSITKSVDLVLMDVRLPDINGYDATHQIKLHKPGLIIIAQTAYASHEEKLKAMDAGCNDYLSKPTMKENLIAMLNKHLAGKPEN